jgi:hypothetical protein
VPDFLAENFLLPVTMIPISSIALCDETSASGYGRELWLSHPRYMPIAALLQGR